MLILGITRVPHCMPSGNVLEVMILLNNSLDFNVWDELLPTLGLLQRGMGWFSIFGPFSSPTLDQSIALRSLFIFVWPCVLLGGHLCLHNVLTLHSVHCSFLRKCFQQLRLVFLNHYQSQLPNFSQDLQLLLFITYYLNVYRGDESGNSHNPLVFLY